MEFCGYGLAKDIIRVEQKLDHLITLMEGAVATIAQLLEEQQGLRSDITQLRSIVDIEQGQVTEALAALRTAVENQAAQIASLEEIVVSGGTPEQRQALLTSMQESRTEIQTAITDIESTVVPAAPEPPAPPA